MIAVKDVPNATFPEEPDPPDPPPDPPSHPFPVDLNEIVFLYAPMADWAWVIGAEDFITEYQPTIAFSPWVAHKYGLVVALQPDMWQTNDVEKMLRDHYWFEGNYHEISVDSPGELPAALDAWVAELWEQYDDG
jgi:hypothetical protein